MAVIRVNSAPRVIRVSPTVAKIIAVAKQGLTGPQGPIGPGGISVQVDTLGIGTGTTAIASLVLASFCSSKWIVLVEDTTNSLKRWQEVGAMKSLTSGLSHTIYGSLGDAMPYTLDVVEVSGSMELQLTNAGVDALNAYVIQMATAV